MSLLSAPPYCCLWWGWKCGNWKRPRSVEELPCREQQSKRGQSFRAVTGQRTRGGMNCLSQHESWVLLMKVPNTQQAAGNRTEFLTRICKDEMAPLYVNSSLCLDCVEDAVICTSHCKWPCLGFIFFICTRSLIVLFTVNFHFLYKIWLYRKKSCWWDILALQISLIWLPGTPFWVALTESSHIGIKFPGLVRLAEHWHVFSQCLSMK